MLILSSHSSVTIIVSNVCLFATEKKKLIGFQLHMILKHVNSK